MAVMGGQDGKTSASRALVRLTRSRLGHNTFWSATDYALLLLSQISSFIIIAGAMGSQSYGAFAGTLALMLILGPITSVGAGFVLVERAVGENEPLPATMARALTTVIGFGSVAALGLIATSRLVLPSSPVALIACLAISELVLYQIVVVVRFAVQSQQRFTLMVPMSATLFVCRAGLAAVYVSVADEVTPVGWGVFYVAGTLAVTCVALLVTRALAGERISPARPRVGDLRLGFQYSLSIGSLYAKNDADKTLLLRLGDPIGAGVYAAAFRVVGALQVPVQALSEASYARLFQERSASRSTLALVRRLTMTATLYSAAVSVVLFVIAPLLPAIIGEDYRPSVSTIRLLSFMPVLFSAQMFAGNAIAGLGHQPRRTRISITAVVVNIALNLVLIPHYSWRGAVWSTLATEFFVVAASWFVLVRIVDRSPRLPEGATMT